MNDYSTVEENLRDYYRFRREIPRIREKLEEVSARLNAFGVSSPQIRSLEEAKYQRGTKIYSTVNLLELIEKEDWYRAELTYKTTFCERMEQMIEDADLTADEEELLHNRYGRGYSLRLLAMMDNSNKNTISRRIHAILARFEK